MVKLVRPGGFMEVNIYNAKANLSKLIQSLIDGDEETVIISKNGKPVVQMTLLSKKQNKRIGTAKKEMEKFNISLDDFNSIPIGDFYGENL